MSPLRRRRSSRQPLSRARAAYHRQHVRLHPWPRWTCSDMDAGHGWCNVVFEVVGVVYDLEVQTCVFE
jgi:hypothetical protein